MSFAQDAWEAIAPIRKAIDELPLLTGIQDGTLPRDTFAYYMAQDAHYLADYGRVLAAAASQTTDADELLFWARSAHTTVIVERELHATHVADFAAIPKSPTCTAYTSYLLSLAAAGRYPALAAGILPCFWIYEDVGRASRTAWATSPDTLMPTGSVPTVTRSSPHRPNRRSRSWIALRHKRTRARSSVCTRRSRRPRATSGCSGTRPGARRPGPSERARAPTRRPGSVDAPRSRESPPPLHTPTLGISADQRTDDSGRHGGVDPNFRTYSARTSTSRVSSSALAQVRGLRPKAEMTDSSTAFRIPPQVHEEGP